MTQPPADEGGVTTMSCGACGTEVPAGAYCGACGARLTEPPTGRRDRLRMGAYAAAPGEHVVRLSVASSLFPHLPHRSRTAFRAGLAVLVLLLIAFALLHWQAAMIAIIALGLPLVFVLYLYEADVDRDFALRSLVPTALLGIGLGVGWAVATGPVVSSFYDVSLADADSRKLAMVVGIAVPVGGAIVMLVPAVVMRFARPTATTPATPMIETSSAEATINTTSTVFFIVVSEQKTLFSVLDCPLVGMDRQEDWRAHF